MSSSSLGRFFHARSGSRSSSRSNSRSNSLSRLAQSGEEDASDDDDDTAALLRRERVDEDDEGDAGLYLRLRIKPSVSTTHSECEVTIHSRSTVGALRESIRGKFSLRADEALRLIYAGKLLAPDSAEIVQFKIPPDAVVHAVISKASTTSTGTHTQTQTQTATESEREQQQQQQQQRRNTRPSGPPRGLDVLIHTFQAPSSSQRSAPMPATLSADEVAAMRAYFADSISAFQAQEMRRGAGESDEDFRLRAETEWMRAQSPYSEFRFNLGALQLLRSSNNAMTEGEETSEDRQGEGAGDTDINRFIRNALGRLQSDSNHGENNATHNNNNSNRDSDRNSNSNSNSNNMSSSQLFWRQLVEERATGAAVDRTNTGTAKDFLLGLMLGYGLGFIMLFCVSDNSEAPFLQKLGLICGVLLSLGENIFRSMYYPSQHGSSRANDPLSTSQQVNIIADNAPQSLNRYLRGNIE